MHFSKPYFLVLLSYLLLIGCQGGMLEALHDRNEEPERVRFSVEKDNLYFFALTADKKIAVFGEKYHYVLEEQKPKEKQLIAKLAHLPFKQYLYSQMGIVNSTKEKPNEITTHLYLALDLRKLSKQQLKTAHDLGFKNLAYKSGFYDMIKQYKPKIDLEKLNREKQIWYREINLVGQRYLPKAGTNYAAKNQYPFSETVEIHTEIEHLPASQNISVGTLLLTPFAAIADVSTGILAVPAYIGLQAVCLGQQDGFICK
ncbi:hypothetical protein ACNO7N_05585 [Bisgaard Taxon 45]